MSYLSTTATSLIGIYSTITSFMVDQGWILEDTLHDYDKIYKSVGEDGKQNHVIRLTIETKTLVLTGGSGTFISGETITGSTSGVTALIVTGGTTSINVIEVKNGYSFTDGETITGNSSGSSRSASGTNFIFENSFKGPDDLHNAGNWILVRAYRYWDSSTHAGIGEIGQFGPLIMQPPSNTQLNWIANKQNLPGYKFTWNDSFINAETGFMIFDNHRKIYAFADGTVPAILDSFGDIGQYDLMDNSIINLGVSFSNSGSGTTFLYAFDKDSETMYLYSIKSTVTLSDTWKRYNLTTETLEALASPPGTISNGATPAPCGIWDGNNFIYVASDNNTYLYRYNISANIWSTLTSPPSTSGNGSVNTACYIPKNCIPGATEDVIYFYKNELTSTLDLYSVTSNSWSTLALPVTGNIGAKLTWDRNRYIYFNEEDALVAGYCFVLDLQNIAAGWSSISCEPSPDAGTNQGTGGFLPMNHFVCKLMGGVDVLNNIDICGDKDCISIVNTNNITDKTYWISFGRSNSYFNHYHEVTTSPITAGINITVHIPTEGLSARESVVFLDPSTGTFEIAKITSIDSAFTCTCTLSNNYTTGTLVYVDYCNTLLTGDSGLAVSLLDFKGFESDNIASVYRLEVAGTEQIVNVADFNIRGKSQIFPILLTASSTNIDLVTSENKGTLLNIFGTSSVGRKVPGDIITSLEGNEYKVFSSEFDRISNIYHLYTIGPME